MKILILSIVLFTSINAMHQITENLKFSTYECRLTHKFISTEWVPSQSSERYFASKYDRNQIVIADILFTFMRIADGHDEYENDTGIRLDIPHDEPYTFILLSNEERTALHCEVSYSDEAHILHSSN